MQKREPRDSPLVGSRERAIILPRDGYAADVPEAGMPPFILLSTPCFALRGQGQESLESL